MIIRLAANRAGSAGAATSPAAAAEAPETAGQRTYHTDHLHVGGRVARRYDGTLRRGTVVGYCPAGPHGGPSAQWAIRYDNGHIEERPEEDIVEAMATAAWTQPCQRCNTVDDSSYNPLLPCNTPGCTNTAHRTCAHAPAEATDDSPGWRCSECTEPTQRAVRLHRRMSHAQAVDLVHAAAASGATLSLGRRSRSEECRHGALLPRGHPCHCDAHRRNARAVAGGTVTAAITTSGPGPYLHATDLARAVRHDWLRLPERGEGPRPPARPRDNQTASHRPAPLSTAGRGRQRRSPGRRRTVSGGTPGSGRAGAHPRGSGQAQRPSARSPRAYRTPRRR